MEMQPPPDTSTLAARVFLAMREYRMVDLGNTVVVAISGGPDSCALLHILHILRSDLGISLVAAHMEHGIRGDESVADMQFVRKFCDSLAISLLVEQIDIPGIAKASGFSLQVAARMERHRFLRDVALQVANGNEVKIALGHTQSDRAETVLMNIVRGAGMDGLGAMPAVRLPIIRPMIRCTRSESADYCTQNDIEFRIDSSNTSTHYTRNRIRIELLPMLKSEYNSEVEVALVRLGEIAADENSFIEEHAVRGFHLAVLQHSPGQVVLDASKVINSHPAIRRRILRLAIGEVRQSLQDVSLHAIDAMLAAMNLGEPYSVTLPRSSGKDITVQIVEGRVSVSSADPCKTHTEWVRTLNNPGSTDVIGWGHAVICRHVFARELIQPHANENHGSNRIWFQCRAIGSDQLQIRTWRHGDILRPKGMTGTKKLQDLYTDNKIAGSDRDRYPVLETIGRSPTILSVLGLRSSNLSLSDRDVSQLAHDDEKSELLEVSWRPLCK